MIDDDTENLDTHTVQLKRVWNCLLQKISIEKCTELLFSQEFVTFLTKNQLKHLITKGAKEQVLTNSECVQVVRATADMMVTKYGMYPGKKAYDGVSNALSSMFFQWNDVILIGALSFFLYPLISVFRILAQNKQFAT